MTREEAIRKTLDTVLWTRNASDDNKNILTDALIEALEQEPQIFKWCTDCREYDQEKHCCHRWSKVIRDTVKEMKQEPILEKISSEIEELYSYVEFDEDIKMSFNMVRLEEVQRVIDKYKEETEVE